MISRKESEQIVTSTPLPAVTAAPRTPLSPLHYVCGVIATFPGRLFGRGRKCGAERSGAACVPGTGPAACPPEGWLPPPPRGHVAVRAAPGTVAEAPGRLYLGGRRGTKPRGWWGRLLVSRRRKHIRNTEGRKNWDSGILFTCFCSSGC